MAQERAFDAFVSYHWQDRAAVEQVARSLQQGGLRLFLDRWYLSPGLPWITALQNILDGCRAVLVFVGPQGVGRWQQREAQLALERQTHELAFPVIPVLLPGADPALGFLSLNTWVDLRSGTSEEALEALTAAVRGEPPGPDMAGRVRAVHAAICPYRGLRLFREEDAAFFCGRQAFTGSLEQAVSRQKVVAVVGASGCGKSSVARAGLLPRLRRTAPGQPVWDIVIMVPGDRPLHSLAAALMPLLKPGLDIVDQRNEGNKLAEYWLAGTTRLSDSVADVLQLQSGTDRLLLLVDQWEELYTLCTDEAQRRRFVDEILAATERQPLTAVLTLRGDFYGRAVSHRGLADRLQDSVVNLGPMTREELRRAITEPAAKVALTFEDGLVDRILDDVGDEPGNLPLLEFVLELLWERRRGGEMHHAAYEEIGKVQGAIAQRADGAYAKLPAAQQAAARRVLVNLVRPGEDTEDTRRRAVLDELGPDARPIVEQLVAARLLVTGRDRSTGEEIVEVTHEALIQRWDTLRKWVDEDREFLRTRERVGVAAERWVRENREPSLLLPPGRPLAEGQDLLEKRRPDLGRDLIEFVDASIAAYQSRLEAERMAQRRRLEAEREARVQKLEVQRLEAEREAERRIARRSRIAAVAIGAFALVAIGAGLFAMFQRSLALIQAELVTRQSEARALAGQAVSLLEARLDLALLLSVESSKRADVSEARDALLRGLEHSVHLVSLLQGHKGRVDSVAFSPDGKILASVGCGKQSGEVTNECTRGEIQLWDAAARRPLGAPLTASNGSEIRSVAFSQDGNTLASAACGESDENRCIQAVIRVWDVATRQPLDPPLFVPVQSTTGLTFSPDGKVLASGGCRTSAADPDDGCVEGEIRLWDVVARQALSPSLVGHNGGVTRVAVSPDGKTLASAGGNSIIVWDLETRRPRVQPLIVSASGAANGGFTSITSLAFSPDSSTLASGSCTQPEVDAPCHRGEVRVWDVATGSSRGALLTELNGGIEALAFSPDGTVLATGSCGESKTTPDPTLRLCTRGRVVLLDLTSREELGFQPPNSGSGVASLAFNPHDGTMASGGCAEFDYNGACVQGEIQVWDRRVRQPLGRFLTAHQGAVESLDFRPDGQMLASGGCADTDNAAGRVVCTKGEVRLWDTSTTLPVRQPIRGHVQSVHALAFSPNGQTLASGSCGKSLNRILNGQYECVQGEVRLWDVGTGNSSGSPLVDHEKQVVSVAYSPDGKMLASADADHEGRVVLWGVASLKRLDPPLMGHTSWLSRIAFNRDSKTLASASMDKSIIFWDVTTHRPLGDPLRRHSEGVLSVAFSSDGQMMASSGRDNSILFWKVETRRQLGAPLRTGVRPARSIGFSADGIMLISDTCERLGEDERCAQNSIQLWDVSTHRALGPPLRGHDGPIKALAVSPAGGAVASGDDHGTVVLWDVGLESWRARACRIANRNFTREEWERYLPEREYAPTCPSQTTDPSVVGEDAHSSKAASADAALAEARTAPVRERGAAYGRAVLSATETIEAALNNEICWKGSLDGFARVVVPACDRAVQLAPFDGVYRDSRGLAKALSGD